MPTYRLTIEYEGTRYRGWQEQKNARSVAGEIRRAVAAARGEVVELGGAGRTDAGVHALGQVAHLRLRSEIAPEPFRRAINDALPADIHVTALTRAAERFHARHDAIWRSYLYQISRRRTALGKRHVWWVKRPLDARRIEDAARRLTGRHDFSAFCESPGEQTSTVVVVDSVEIAESGALVLVRVVASHFLWKMVRRIVGTLVRVGAGELPVEDLQDLIDAAAPAGAAGGTAAWTAPPSGLFLERVAYRGESVPGPLVPAVPILAEPASPLPGQGWIEAPPRPHRRRPPGQPGRARRPRG
jgi:tRNA pseudouridine38-40 synthase